MTSLYLQQYWFIVNWSLQNKLQWKLNQNSNIFIQENVLEKDSCEMTAILSTGRWVQMSCVWCICVLKQLGWICCLERTMPDRKHITHYWHLGTWEISFVILKDVFHSIMVIKNHWYQWKLGRKTHVELFLVLCQVITFEHFKFGWNWYDEDSRAHYFYHTVLICLYTNMVVISIHPKSFISF